MVAVSAAAGEDLLHLFARAAACYPAERACLSCTRRLSNGPSERGCSTGALETSSIYAAVSNSSIALASSYSMRTGWMRKLLRNRYVGPWRVTYEELTAVRAVITSARRHRNNSGRACLPLQEKIDLDRLGRRSVHLRHRWHSPGWARRGVHSFRTARHRHLDGGWPRSAGAIYAALAEDSGPRMLVRVGHTLSSSGCAICTSTSDGF